MEPTYQIRNANLWDISIKKETLYAVYLKHKIIDTCNTISGKEPQNIYSSVITRVQLRNWDGRKHFETCLWIAFLHYVARI